MKVIKALKHSGILALMFFAFFACEAQTPVPGIGGMQKPGLTEAPGEYGDAFVTEWNLPAGDFTFPVADVSGTYDFIISWGDGSTSEIENRIDPDLTHTYASAGTYIISIEGTLSRIYINSNSVAPYIIKVLNWGNVGFTSFERAFRGATNLEYIPDGPITGVNGVLSFYYAFTFSKLTYIPSDIFDNCPDAWDFSGVFGVTDITSIPSGLFVNTSASDFYYSFTTCEFLESIPDDLFDGLTPTRFYRTFYNCSGITSAVPDLWNDYPGLSSSVTSDCFYGCTNASNYASIPVAWR